VWIFFFVLSLLAVHGGAAAAPPRLAEPLTLRLMGSRSPLQGEWEDLRLFTHLARETQLSFTFDTPPDEAYEERKNLAFASGALPDLFFGGRLSSSDEVTYGSQGFLLPLEELIAEHAPNLSRLLAENPALRRSITTPDGHIYALPALTAGFGIYPKLWLNRAWLDALGLEAPTTTEALYEVLSAFKTGDPNGNGEADEIPLSATNLEDWPLGDVRPGVLAAFGFSVPYGPALFDVVGERVRFIPSEPEFFEYLSFMNRLYREGLLDPDSYTQDFLQLVAKGDADRLGAFATAGPFLVVGTERNEAFAQLSPLVTEVGLEPRWPVMSNILRGTFAITARNPDPVATLRWVDYFYSEAGALLLVNGVEGRDWEATAAGGIRRLYPEDVNPEVYRATTLTPDVGTQLPHNREPVYARASRDWAETNPQNFYIAEQTRLKLEPHATPTFPLLYFTDAEQQPRPRPRSSPGSGRLMNGTTTCGRSSALAQGGCSSCIRTPIGATSRSARTSAGCAAHRGRLERPYLSGRRVPGSAPDRCGRARAA
jgi:putative aldouronate transport system substrate-binding protein